jgi:hypothetical protein
VPGDRLANRFAASPAGDADLLVAGVVGAHADVVGARGRERPALADVARRARLARLVGDRALDRVGERAGQRADEQADAEAGRLAAEAAGQADVIAGELRSTTSPTSMRVVPPSRPGGS